MSKLSTTEILSKSILKVKILTKRRHFRLFLSSRLQYFEERRVMREVKLRHRLSLVDVGYRAYSYWCIRDASGRTLCSGDYYSQLSRDLFSFTKLIRSGSGPGSTRTEEYLFSLAERRVLSFGEYSGSNFEMFEGCWVRGLFLKTVRNEAGLGGIGTEGGWGVFDPTTEKFIIGPGEN